MPMKMKVPAEPNHYYGDEVDANSKPKKRKPKQPKLYIPIQADWIDDLEPGQEITVTLSGEILKVQVSKKAEEEYGMENELCLAVKEVAISGENEFSKLVKSTEED